MKKPIIDTSKFNTNLVLPYELRLEDFSMAMQDVYDLFHDMNCMLSEKGLNRLDDTLRPAAMSGVLSDMLTSSVANHARALVVNQYFNGHPDLLQHGVYSNNAISSGDLGVEIKCTRKAGGAVDTHAPRNQWMCVFVYKVDNVSEPIKTRSPMKFTEIYLARVETTDFRKNPRGELGSRTATLHRDGLKKFRKGWVYLDKS